MLLINSVLSRVLVFMFFLYNFSCDQAALWMVQSFCLSITTFSLCSHHHIFSRSSYQWQKWCPFKIQGQRSKVMVTEVKTQLKHFQNVTLVWFHWALWNDNISVSLFQTLIPLNKFWTCKILKKYFQCTDFRVGCSSHWKFCLFGAILTFLAGIYFNGSMLPSLVIRVQQCAFPTIRSVSRYGHHDTIRI